MIDALEPVWKQFEETYTALRVSLAKIPDDRLDWKPGPQATTASWIIQHIARANRVYSYVVRQIPPPPRDYREGVTADWLLERLDESEGVMRETFEGLKAEELTQICADNWCPLNEHPIVEGPLDAFWFCHQIVRHSAYHLGQINLYLLLLEID